LLPLQPARIARVIVLGLDDGPLLGEGHVELERTDLPILKGQLERLDRLLWCLFRLGRLLDLLFLSW